ncbi:hypothetical protein L873DRAFT_1702870 [Choiromyces venosus 120613-1]|uniref:DDE-1 domain-containing protein n=1 Tax=Choiromyces venosus 120613-1 TaxID=1336337 RepID=A0A3N4JBN9_9PEZI|nr:hypothetical protein L873DRAFT_1702870 [Choiromyces venosus 120613-1]
MQIGIHWHLRFLERHPDLALKYSRQIEYLRCTAEQSYFILKGFFERLKITIEKYEIKKENHYNFDEIRFLMGWGHSAKVITSNLREKGALRAQDGNREMVTILETGCADGSFEDPMIIFKSEGISEGWVENEKFAIPDGVMVGYSPNGWTDNEKAMAFIKHFFGPGSKTTQKANGQFQMLLFDGHSSHIH